MPDTATPTAPAPVRPPMSLMSHQQQIHDFLVHQPFGGAWLGVGTGKTMTTLSVLQTVRPMGHILVVAPVAIARSTWLDEIEKWGFPIRTKSLIVNENDKKLSREKRLERFQEVFNDPPTMYFVNQELLTQPSQTTKLITPAQSGPTKSAVGQAIVDLVRTQGPLSRDDLIQACQASSIGGSGGKSAPKAKINAWAKELVDEGLLVWESHDCDVCAGDGCRQCQFGLVDQMPIQKIDGKDTIIWPFQTVIIDESQGFKSHSSSRFKALKRVRPAINRLIELTGTPSPNGLHDLWSQVYLLDQGKALGKTITAFRDRWFTPKMVAGTSTPAKWIPTGNAEVEIHEAIKHLVMSAQNTTLKLPALTIQDVNVTLPPDLVKAYKDFKRDLVLDVISTYTDDEGRLTQSIDSIIVENQAVLTSKLMQFASGTLYTADPDDPTTAGRYRVIHDKKLEMAEYLIRNNGSEPVLLAYHFKSDKEQLVLRMKKAGIDIQVFDGSREMVRRWNAKKIPVMLIHPASAGHGLNFQHGGSTLIWYTLTHNLEWYLQANGRLHRTGQTKPVTIYRLITKGTQDERMPLVLAEKERTQTDLIQAVSTDHAEEFALLQAIEAEIHDDLNDFWASERL